MTKNVNLPILQNVLVKAEGGTIKFTSTNLEIAVNCVVRGKVDEPGEHTVPSKLFYDYVSLLPSETIRLDTDDDNIRLQCGNHKTKINGLSASEFPLVPKVNGEEIYRIPVGDLKAALSQVLFAVATNESRPELTGVLMHFSSFESEGRLKLVATDSYRLSEATITLLDRPGQERSVVVPAKTLSEVLRVLSVFKDDVELPTTVSLQLSQSQAVFIFGPVELISRVIDENYPDYQQIIPKQFSTRAILDKEDFIKAVKTASLFSKNGLFDVTLAFEPTAEALHVQATDATRGDNISSCGAEISGQPNTVSVNYRYLLDGLQAIVSDQVVFEMIDGANPCLISPAQSTQAYRYVLMPIRS